MNVVLALITLLAVSALAVVMLDSGPTEAAVWVRMDPVQCLGNPWEQDWLAGHPDGRFPQEREAEIITAFYEQEGITVFAVRIEQTHDAVCAACGCPRGYAVFLQVSSDDADVLAWHGFVPEGEADGREMPAADIVLEGQDISLTCIADADCQLINSDHGIQCCWEGACEPVDYSEENWIAVNRESYQAAQWNICPRSEECGPAPGCPVHVVNDRFEAKCVENVCRKMAKGTGSG